MLVGCFILHARLRVQRAAGIPCALCCSDGTTTSNTGVRAAGARSCVCWAGAVSVGQLTREYAVVMAGLGDEALLRADVPAIHVFLAVTKPGRGSPGQAR